MRMVPCVLALFLVASASAQPAGDAQFVADTREYLQRLETLGFAGSVLVARGGKPLIAEGFGMADRERNLPWNPASIGDIGSITKQFTGAAILALAEDGKLAVKDPITKFFDDVPEDKEAITVHQLLTHSSGILDLPGLGDWDPIGREEFVRRALAEPLAFEPGARYDYSNAGYSLLGAIIEQLTGTSWEAHMRELFFEPLGLYDTGYILAPWGEARLAQGYRGEDLWGTTVGRAMADDGPYWVLRANGGIHMPLWDMLRWTSALAEGRILSAESRKLLWEPHVREGADAPSFYGYGWVVMEIGGIKLVGHNGGNGTFFADLALIPETNTVIFLMTNVASGNRYTNGMLEQILFRLLEGRSYPEVPRVVPVDPARAAALAGPWILAGGGRLQATVERDALVVEPRDPSAFAVLLSTTPQSEADRILADQRSEQILPALRAMLKSDFVPLHRLYGGAVTIERLTSSWTTRLSSAAERIGPLQDASLIGVARRGERDFLLVRVRGERGVQDYTFVWNAAPDGRILGISTTGIEPRLRFQPEASGGWAAFDRSSGASVPMRVEEGRLVIGRGDAAVGADRP
jgi:CubicO group peptidase (beta-lactamase class C family)